MKGLPFTVMFLVFATAIAAAKPVPVSKMNPMEDLTTPVARNDVDINSGPAGALLERDYFQARSRPEACLADCNRPFLTRCTSLNCVASVSRARAREPTGGKNRCCGGVCNSGIRPQ